ncbi:hypothetical protein ACTXT7_014190 [Hymenolepis weldensis]
MDSEFNLMRNPFAAILPLANEGMDFILRLSLAILKQFAPRLLTMDMETMIFPNLLICISLSVD